MDQPRWLDINIEDVGATKGSHRSPSPKPLGSYLRPKVTLPLKQLDIREVWENPRQATHLHLTI